MRSHDDYHGRLFSLDSESRSCWWSFMHSHNVADSTVSKHVFKRMHAWDDETDESENENKESKEEENTNNPEPVEDLLERARQRGRTSEVFRDIICEFHGEYWIYECFYNPLGGKIRVPWASNRRVWAGPFYTWCQKRNVIKPSLTYFNQVHCPE